MKKQIIIRLPWEHLPKLQDARSGRFVRNDAAKCGIYRIVNLANGKTYTGSAVNTWWRRTRHRISLNRGIHGNRHLQAAWLKYGEAHFAFESIEIVADAGQLLLREQWWMDKSRSCNRACGYNFGSARGSQLGLRRTPEQLARQRIATQRAWALGLLPRKATPETLLRLSLSHMGIRHSKATREKMSRTRKGRKLTKAWSENISRGVRQAWQDGAYANAKVGRKPACT